MKRNAKTIEETSKYKIVVENRFDNIPLTFKIWKNTNLKELKIDDGFARAIGYNSLKDMKDKEGKLSLIHISWLNLLTRLPLTWFHI